MIDYYSLAEDISKITALQGWNGSHQSSDPTSCMNAGMLILNHPWPVFIQPHLENLQWNRFQNFPGMSTLLPDCSNSKEVFPDILSKATWLQFKSHCFTHPTLLRQERTVLSDHAQNLFCSISWIVIDCVLLVQQD